MVVVFLLFINKNAFGQQDKQRLFYFVASIPDTESSNYVFNFYHKT
jgi:hypothetical protein